MTLQPLNVSAFSTPPVRDHGGRPTLLWVALADCGVDADYQRELTPDSRKRIAAIAAAFDWSCFSPMLIAPAEGGRYAIIDGQHRARAALLVGEREAPAMLIDADIRGQARAFAAVNGNITRITPRSIYRAALAAGDAETLAVEAVARHAGVHVLTYPLSIDRMKPGDTISTASLMKAMRDHGAETLERALVAIMASKGDKRGLLNSAQIRGLCLVFREKPLALATIRAAFARVDLRDAEVVARRDGCEGLYSDLAREVKARLAKLAARP